MEALLVIVTLGLGIAQLVCWVIVMVKLFQNNDIMLGVLGIFCGLITFIAGWIKADELNAKKVMTIWTALWIIHMLVTAALVVMRVGGNDTMLEMSAAPEMM